MVVSLESRPIYFIQVKYLYMPHAIIFFDIWSDLRIIELSH
jgi:hypothetical protein